MVEVRVAIALAAMAVTTNALGGLPPTTFRERQTAENSTYELST
jgi:hypothetical protein